MLNIGVLVSGGGTNLQAIINSIKDKYLKDCRIATVVSSRKKAYALNRASMEGIPCTVISKKDYNNPEEFDAVLTKHMKKYDVGLIVLAGYLSMLGKGFVQYYKNKIINIHPSLIPAFSGKGYYGIIPHQKALEYGVKVTGATVHFVDFEYDTGPVIIQRAVYVKDDDTPESLQERVMCEAEWQILPEAIKLFSEGKLLIKGRKVKISE